MQVERQDGQRVQRVKEYGVAGYVLKGGDFRARATVDGRFDAALHTREAVFHEAISATGNSAISDQMSTARHCHHSSGCLLLLSLSGRVHVFTLRSV